MEDSDNTIVRAPRTRSQVAPVWTVREALILVNEIAAVEGDCLKALSSYQKWKIIVENCNALDLTRTVNQCRSKWNSLLDEYNQIKRWDSKSKADSFWLLDCETRKQFNLPEDFDKDLFKAIDDHVESQKDPADTDPDNDPEAEADFLKEIAKLGHKRQKREPLILETEQEEDHQDCFTIEQPQKVEEDHQDCFTIEQPQKVEDHQDCLNIEQPQKVEEDHQNCFTVEQSQKVANDQNCFTLEEPHEAHIDEEPQRDCGEENPLISCEETQPQIVDVEEEPHGSHGEEKSLETCRKEAPQETNAEEKTQNSLVQQKPKRTRIRKKRTISMQEQDTEKMMIERLRENAELIHCICMAKANVPRIAEDLQSDFIRRQGDKLIACLEDIVGILGQYPKLLQESV